MSTTPAEPILAFAGYFLDVRQRLLIGPDGVPVNISSRAFETLLVLASHPHELIDKHRLMKAVWPNSIVEENNLNQQISTLRRLLGEATGEHGPAGSRNAGRQNAGHRHAGRRFIVTVTGQGYRFVQDVRRLDSLPVAAEDPPPESPSENAASVAVNGSPDESPTCVAPDVRAPRRWRTLRPMIVAAASVLLMLGATYVLLAGREPGGTRNIEAYVAYLSARAVTNNGGSSRAREAIELLERAVELDPDFALAWAALAESYTYAVDFPPSSALPITPVELQRRTSRAALRAFELAPDSPRTLLSAGMVSMQNRDWAEAERRLRKAVELAGPSDYDANLLYALFLMNVGRTSEAILYVERAVRAEPLLMRPIVFLAALHEMRGQFDKAEALLTAGRNLEGHEQMRKQGLVMIHLARHDQGGLRRVLTPKGGTLPCLDDPAGALAQFRKSYTEATRSGALGYLGPVAIFASFLGDRTLALDALRANGSTQNVHAIWRPVMRDVRRTPGFAQLVQDLGLVDYWRESGNWGEFCRETAGGGFTCGQSG